MSDGTLTHTTLLPFLTRTVASFAYAVFGSNESTVDTEEIVVVPRLDASAGDMGCTFQIAIDFADNARRRTITDPDVLRYMLDDATSAYCAVARAVTLRVSTAEGVDVCYVKLADGMWQNFIEDAVVRPQCAAGVIGADFDVDAFTKKAFVFLECAASASASDALDDAHVERAMAGLNNALARHRARLYSTRSNSWLCGFSRLRQCSALVRSAQHSVIDGVDWCACVNVCVRLESECRAADDIESGSIEVFVNGSMLSRKETNAVVAHLWTLDEELWSSFALLPLRLDARRDAPNAGHAVFFTSTARLPSEAYISNIAVHFMANKSSLRDMHASTMVFSHADPERCRTSTLLNPIPIATSSALINAGVFDALRLLKRQYGTTFATREEMQVHDAAIESARAALSCLVDPITESTRVFLAEQARLRGPDWQSQLLRRVGHIAAFRANEQLCERIARVG
jgi:hypothetical protein